MRCAVLLLLATTVLAGTPGLYPGLTAEQRTAIENTNKHNIEKLALETHVAAGKFLDDVKANDAVIKLGHSIAGGHSIMYEFVEGPKGAAAKIKGIAQKYGLQVLPSSQCKCKGCCGRILLPGKDVDIVEAVAVAGKRQDRKGNATNVFEPLKPLNKTGVHEQTVQEAQDKARTKFFKLTADQVTWYHENNLAQISKMNAEAQPFIKKFVDDLREKAPKTVIHFMEPIRNGYSVRFTHVEGPLAPVKQWAQQCGLVLKGRTLTAPKGEAHTAEVIVTEKAHVETDMAEQALSGAPMPIEVKAPALPKVPALQDKWLPAFVEEDDSLMDLFDEADHAADSLSEE